MRVVFSKIAEIHRNEILEFLTQNWTEKEVKTFVEEYESVVDNLKAKLVTYPFYSRTHKIQYALIGKKHVKMFFKIYPKENLILVFDFFNVKKNPNKINKL